MCPLPEQLKLRKAGEGEERRAQTADALVVVTTRSVLDIQEPQRGLKGPIVAEAAGQLHEKGQQ